MFLLSSENFLQAYKRAQYMKQYASYRKMQGEEIKTKSAQLLTFNSKLEVQKTEKQKLIEEQEKERLKLEQDKKEQEILVNSIKKEKKKTLAEIKKKQQESRAIDRQIDKLIREAIIEANKKAAEANRKANPKKVVTAAETKAIETSTKIILTPEAKIIADNFKANRGKLPWPVEKGTVYSGFGDQPHPVYKTLTVHNSGVDIATEDGSSARAVFGGIVTKVIVLSPVNKAVFIQHGDYFTVYQNLSSVNVSKGDKVSIKQSLGRIRTNGDSGKTILKFMILQNTTPNNPSSWLYNM
jgi:septal ring factor EnvC (AmiA/AmiB activator)